MILDATFEKRKKFIPKAEAIIEEIKSRATARYGKFGTRIKE
jgi:hypothetical protein